MYITAETQGMFRHADHRELIDKYSQEGWRFVTAIATDFSSCGQVKEYDLVFEKEE